MPVQTEQSIDAAGRNAAIPASPSADEHKQSAPADAGDEGLYAHDDPFALFGDWFAMAREHEPRDPHAMVISTVDSDGMPDSRTVLLKDFDAKGFVFYTNTQSAKGAQLSANGKAALCFYWRSTVRQVRVRGVVEAVSAAEADAYFATRAKDSQIGAWASDQSRALALDSRAELEDKIAALETQYADEHPPRPPHWSGYRVVPLVMEFWRERPFRLHDRLQFSRETPGGVWGKSRLYP